MNGPSDGLDRTLFLSPEPPYPLAGGGPMRTASLLQYLAERSRVHLVTFAEDGSPNPECDLPRGLVDRITTVYLPFHRRDPVSRIYRNTGRVLRGRLPLMDRFGRRESLERVRLATQGGRYSLGVIEHFWGADYLELMRACCDRVVLNLHNIESHLHARCSRTEPWPAGFGHLLFSQPASRLERRLLDKFDLVLAASEQDARAVRRLAPRAEVSVYPNAIPLRDTPHAREEDVIAFSGNLEYHPNVRAVRYFREEIWPELRALRPELVWRLIGKNEAAVRHLIADDPRIEVTGPVEDAVAELARAKIAIVPLLAGSGTRVKIVEAWAAARAVVSTALGAEGLPVSDGENVALADGKRQWIEQVTKLLDFPTERERLGAAGRSAYERDCCWQAAWRTLEESPAALTSHVRSAWAI